VPLRRDAQARRDDVVAALGALVGCESPSGDPRLLARCADHLRDRFGSVGDVRDMAAATAPAPHLLVEVRGAQPERPPLLVLGHYDTVWPAGTLRERPFAVDAHGVARGPGVFDMKGGIVVAWLALTVLQARGIRPHRTVRLSLSPDEEIGNPASRDRLARLAAASPVVLVLEPPLPGGVVKTSRGGHATVRLDVRGRAAHAGVDPGAGVSAATEAAVLTLRAQALADPARGTTVAVGRLRAGHAANVIPAEGRLDVDVRARDPHELRRVLDGLQRLRPAHPDAGVRATIVSTRPPMPRGAATDAILDRLRAPFAALGLPLADGHTGGVSEGNLVAAAGACVVDGLGPTGGGAHQADEHVDVASVLDRAAVLAAFLAAADGA
jgi:glutamate carboxypeptidase